ncbi:MAG: DUF5335 family protein [Fibrella sp.]|nr:DUF5335 family protein [Armatimonadota bacterium]
MATHEIPQDQWESFFAVFSERRNGALVTVELADPQKGPRKAETNQPLTGITIDDAGSVLLQLGGTGSDTVTRTITEPKAVYHKSAAGVMSDEVNHDEIIEITSAGDPPITQLHFSGQ